MSSHCSFELKIVSDTFCCFPQFFNLWTLKKFTIITLWVKTFKEKMKLWILTFLNSKKPKRHHERRRDGQGEKGRKEGTCSWVSLENDHIPLVCPSVLLNAVEVRGEPREDPKTKWHWLPAWETQRTVLEESKFYSENRFFKKKQIFQFRRNKRVPLSPASESSLTNDLGAHCPLGSAQIDLVINSNVFLASPLHQHISGF